MDRKRFYLTAVIARDIYDKPLCDKNGHFLISHWVHRHERFYPRNLTNEGFEYLEDKSGEKYIPLSNSETKVYFREKRNVIYELVLP